MDRRLFAVVLHTASAQYYEPESSGWSRYYRQFAPGAPKSVFFKGSFNSTYNPYAYRGPLTIHPDGQREQTFLSAPLELKPGEVVQNFVPINWPEGKIRITSYSGDLVKLAPGAVTVNETVIASRDEVYLHHWTVNKWQMGKDEYDSFVQKAKDFDAPGPDAGQNHGANGPCGPYGLHSILGAGNEVRGPPMSGADATYAFPDPYGIESDSEEMHAKGILMLMNVHLIDLRGVDNIRGCSECECDVLGVKKPSGKGYDNYIGGLECCHSTALNGGKCPSSAAPTVQTYFIKYTITWREENDPVYSNQPFRPLNVMILEQTDDGARWYDPIWYQGTVKQAHDALHKDTMSMASLNSRKSGQQYTSGPQDIHGCHVEYFVPECASGEACEHHFHNSWTMPFDMEVVVAHSHFHNAGINMTTSVQNGEAICTGLPTYQDGFLVEISSCTLSRPLFVSRDQTLLVETFYTQDDRPHFGVMGFSVLYVHRLDLDRLDAVLV